MNSVICPWNFQIYRRSSDGWTGLKTKRVIYNNSNQSMQLDRVAEQFGLTDRKVVIELFRQYLGKEGYYLVNLRDRQYYYCGLSIDDVKNQLSDLGIGYAKG
jgi:hypothetical protein